MIEIAKPGHRNNTGIKKRPKEARKKHDLTEDEPAHAPPEACINAIVVAALLRLTNNFSEPAKEHVGENAQAKGQHVWSVGLVVDGTGHAHHKKEHAYGANHRPFAR